MINIIGSQIGNEAWTRNMYTVRLQITTGGYRTKHGRAIRTEFVEKKIRRLVRLDVFSNGSGSAS